MPARRRGGEGTARRTRLPCLAAPYRSPQGCGGLGRIFVWCWEGRWRRGRQLGLVAVSAGAERLGRASSGVCVCVCARAPGARTVVGGWARLEGQVGVCVGFRSLRWRVVWPGEEPARGYRPTVRTAGKAVFFGGPRDGCARGDQSEARTCFCLYYSARPRAARSSAVTSEVFHVRDEVWRSGAQEQTKTPRSMIEFVL